MNGDILIYNSIVDIGKKENNKLYNQQLLEIFLQPFHSTIENQESFKEKIALAAIDIAVESSISDVIIQRLIDIRDDKQTLSQEFISTLYDAYHQHTNWNKIMRVTKDLSILVSEDKLFEYINPKNITQELIKAGVNKKEAYYYHD